MSFLTRAIATVTGATAMLLIVSASHVRIPVHSNDDALLRIAWTARPERVETCRTASDEELAALPQHMRQRVICEGFAASYRLEVLSDGVLLESSDVRGGGLRNDRQLYVFREFPIRAGQRAVEVRLTRNETIAEERTAPDSMAPTATPQSETERESREREEHRRRVEYEVAASLSLRETISVAPREVVLVTYDRVSRQLRIQRGLR